MLGSFFYPVEGFLSLKEVSLKLFYHLGGELRFITSQSDNPASMAEKFKQKREFLIKLLAESEGVPFTKTRNAVAALEEYLKQVIGEAEELSKTSLTDKEFRDKVNARLKELVRDFEDKFEHDSRNLWVFAVTPKDDRDLGILIEDSIQNWPPEELAVLPDKTKDDLREAARCLAFERATACAFHVCRATEVLMLAYYEKLAAQPWPHAQKDWGKYNQELIALNAPERITTRLDEIRKMDRNAYAHPDLTVPIDEAPIIYGLCRGVIFLMAKEMV